MFIAVTAFLLKIQIEDDEHTHGWSSLRFIKPVSRLRWKSSPNFAPQRHRLAVSYRC